MITIRKIKQSEICMLDSFLYEAIFIPKGHEKPKKDIIKIPELSVYINNFGKETDICFVAEINGELIGAAWSRIFCQDQKGFGFIDSETPEICMSVFEKYQKQGVGTKLLYKLLDKLMDRGYKKVSLSVDLENYALKLYQKFGFEIVQSDNKSATMIKQLKL